MRDTATAAGRRTFSQSTTRALRRALKPALVLLFGTLPFAAAASAQSSSDWTGEWKLAFSAVSRAGEASAKPAPWITFTATVVQVDSTLGGALRSDGPSGQFGCRLREGACKDGRMRLSWDQQDWQVFEFTLDTGSTRQGTGRAEIRFPDGGVDKYIFVISRS